MPPSNKSNYSVKLREIDAIKAIANRGATNWGATFITKRCVSEKLIRGEDFVKRHWNDDAYEKYGCHKLQIQIHAAKQFNQLLSNRFNSSQASSSSSTMQCCLSLCWSHARRNWGPLLLLTGATLIRDCFVPILAWFGNFYHIYLLFSAKICDFLYIMMQMHIE